MSITVSVDTSEVDQFVATLNGVGARLPAVVGPTFKRAAQNIKEATQADMSASGDPGFRAIAGKVSYDEPSGGGTSMQTEIGIDKGGAGNLGNIAVFGTYKGGGTRQHPSEHAEKEMPNFEAWLLKAVEDLF